LTLALTSDTVALFLKQSHKLPCFYQTRKRFAMPISFRAQHIGSLLRPADLLQARAAHAAGGLPLEQLRAAEDRAILQVLEKQRQMGLDVVTDGEMRRGSWLTDMADAVDGFVSERVPLEWKGPGGGMEGSTAFAAGAKLRKLRKMTGHEVPFLKKNTRGPFKVTLPAPSNFMLASFKTGITDKFYPTHADLLKDLAEIVRDDVQWLVSEGVQYIQFDAPFYSHYLDPLQRARMRQAGRSPDKELENAIAGDNAALRDVPRSSVTVGLHVCRGNNRSRWFTEGGYDAIAEKLFGQLQVDRFLLEYDTERSGGFEPLRLVPRGKSVVLGLITTKGPKLESQNELRRRIDQASKYVPLENLALSPQCGFASTAAGNLLSMDEQWKKLELVVDTARKVWGTA
jgi:5-methyltetrahydropteroyltriglutamate--homocysteine methyltransferase